MSERPELWTCSQCGFQQDISQLGFYAEIQCPQCGNSAHVHSMLANYKVESILGIGGMSVVFKAQDLVLGRPLAIKVLNETYRDTPERIAGIGNECSLMAKIRHDNVVSVYSAGWARGQFFIAMELVDGRNLELIVEEQGSLPPMEAIEIIRQVAQGLNAAHEAGILHRDVKPGNVLIAADGHAKVLDFGLSLDEKSGTEESDIIWATPYYVPPETLRREEENVQSDIYALGMTLRNLLTGDATLPNSPQTIADMLVEKKTLPSLSQVNPQLHPSLCLLVDSMSAFDPAERPANYEELLVLIEEVQQELQNAENPQYQNKRKREKLFLSAGAAACVVLGLAGATIVSMSTPSATIHETMSVGEFRWLECDTCLAAKAHLKAGELSQAGDMLGQLTHSEMEPALSGAAVLLRTALDVLEGKSSANGYKRFAEVVARKGQVAAAGADTLNQLEAFVAAIQGDVSKAGQAADSIQSPMLKFAAQVLVADYYVHSGDDEKAAAQLVTALETLKTAELAGTIGKVEEFQRAVPRRAARVLYERARGLFRDGQYDAAIKCVESMPVQKLSKVEREKLRIMSEAVPVMQAIHETLLKHNRNVKPGMTPQDLRTAAAGLGSNEKVPKEFYCIALILSGEMEAAFRENPHASESPDSQQPFVVMMQDWRTRLGL